MAHRNDGGPSSGRATAVKEEEEKKSSGILPYVVGGLIGVGAGLLGSLLIDKAVDHFESTQQESALRSGRSEKNSCAVCLDEVEPSFKTRCCGKLLHTNCLLELKKHQHSWCPFCRSRSWLG